MESENESEGRPDRSRRFRVAILSLAIAVGVACGYLFLYPMMLIAILEWGWLDNGPNWLWTLIDGSVVPLEWLVEHSSYYERYINWWEEVIET